MNASGGGRKILSMLTNIRKDRDEDLLLFRELHKREHDRLATLLLPVSDEFEANGGNHVLYRIATGKKGSGHEHFGENGKNDYDWLKTPPATPLFPSLEMEANAPGLVLQREIPILQPRSRFAGNSEASKGSTGGSESANPKPRVHVRSISPGQRPCISSAQTKNTSTTSYLPTTDRKNRRSNAVTNSTVRSKETHVDFVTSNLSKNGGTDPSKTKPRSRGVSPSVRSIIPSQIPGFSHETPPNLKTDRSASASRGRPGNPAFTVHPKPEANAKPRRQSCSPSVTRGRKVEPSKQENEGKITNAKGKIQTGNRTAQIMGSRMVEKVMNARKSWGNEERQTKPRSPGGRTNESARSSSEVALRHTEVQQSARVNSRRTGNIVPGKGSSSRG